MSKNVKDKKGSNKKKVIIFSLVIIIVIGIIGVASYALLKPEETEDTPKNVNEVTIDGYGIYADDNDSELYREEYEKLRENLLSDEIDYDEYARSVAKMFIIDLYTIKNKTNKYDVGGVDFVWPDGLENYRTNVTDTIYKYVEDNSNNDRDQQLPVVNSIEIVSEEQSTFEIDDVGEYDSYTFELSWTYSNDYGYDTEGEVIVIRDNDRMYVVEKN